MMVSFYHSLLPHFLCCSWPLTGFPQLHFASAGLPDTFFLGVPVTTWVTCGPRSWGVLVLGWSMVPLSIPVLAWVIVPWGCQDLLWHEGSPTDHISLTSWLLVSFPNTSDPGDMHFPAWLTPSQGFGGWWLLPGASSIRD